jgi:hypothetical protein
MKAAFDDRLVSVDIGFPSGTRTYSCAGTQGFSIYATGQKFDAAPMNECEIKIFNLTPSERNFIISQTSPLVNPRILIPITLNVGRLSYGTFILYSGFIGLSNTTQPPDIGVILTAQTNYTAAGITTAVTQQAQASLNLICQNIATQNGLTLNFLATDRQIANHTYNGALAYQVNQLNNIGDIVASVDNLILTVKNKGAANSPAILINAANGMVGIPSFTFSGVRITMMVNNIVNLGNLINLQSEMLPAANGNYIVQKILFDIASRDNQFFYTLECISQNYSTSAGSTG